MKFRRQWTRDTVDVLKACPYVLIRHVFDTQYSYFLNRNYELIWDKQFETMIASEEQGWKKMLFSIFKKHQVQTERGWVPTHDYQKPAKCSNLSKEAFQAFWIPEYYKLDTTVLTGLLMIGDMVGGVPNE